MSEVLVRAARQDELDKVGRICVEAYGADGYFAGDAVEDGYAAALGDAARRAAHAEVWVAVGADDTPVGTVTVVTPGTEYAEVCRDGELEFRMLAVAPAARGRGVGETLVRAVLDHARTLGRSRVVLCTWDQKTVHQLYARMGFRRIPDRDWNPMPDVHLIAFAQDLT